jgi:hypothetical protein
MPASDTFSDSKAVAQRVPIPTQPLPSRFLPGIPSKTSSSRVAASTPPWWLWWNILSLDAPTVAVIWAAVFAHAAGITVRPSDEITLGLAVGTIYIADRLLDGWRSAADAALQERHLFCARHRTALLAVLVPASAGILWIATHGLTAREVKAGLILAAIVATYIVGIHAARGFPARLLPKELTVGILFAAGTTLPLWSQAATISPSAWLSVILFALLCSLNCLAIEYWENVRSFETPRHTASTRMDGEDNHIYWLSAALGIAAPTVPLVGPSQRFAKPIVAISVAAFLLLLLHLFRNRFSRPALRVLADAVLVVAGLFALLLQA